MYYEKVFWLVYFILRASFFKVFLLTPLFKTLLRTSCFILLAFLRHTMAPNRIAMTVMRNKG